MRFASRENTRLGHPNRVDCSGGGGTERLPHLVGRGRALEMFSREHFDGDTRTIRGRQPDFQRRTWTARRLARAPDRLFARRAMPRAKNLVNQVSLPSADRLLAAITSLRPR